MKNTVLAASLAVSLLSTAAFAQSYAPSPPSGAAYGVTYGYGYGDADPRDRDGDGDFDRRDRRGRYELQTTQQWVPGPTTQVWVNGVCTRSPSGLLNLCTQGHYETRQAPGRYVTVQQWVWVPDVRRHHRWGRHWHR